MLNLADPQKLRFIPVVFLYMERDNVFLISILLIKREAPVIQTRDFFQFETHMRIHDVKPEVAVNIIVSLVEKKYAVLLIDAA
jgi:hypothetical protein